MGIALKLKIIANEYATNTIDISNDYCQYGCTRTTTTKKLKTKIEINKWCCETAASDIIALSLCVMYSYI